MWSDQLKGAVSVHVRSLTQAAYDAEIDPGSRGSSSVLCHHHLPPLMKSPHVPPTEFLPLNTNFTTVSLSNAKSGFLSQPPCKCVSFKGSIHRIIAERRNDFL